MTGRMVGVDLGSVRVGLAVSDPDGVVATPLRTIAAGGGSDVLVAALAEVAREVGAAGFVVGLPRTLAGREESAAVAARETARRLTEVTGLPVELCDERFTSVEADRVMLAGGARRRARRAASDRVAATLILQSYLDARRHGARSHG